MAAYTIEISEDVNRALINRQEYVGERADTVLRRLLGLPTGRSDAPDLNESGTADTARRQLAEFLHSPEFVRHRNATDRYLELLGWLGQNHAEDAFEEKLLAVQGRTRLYFARTAGEIYDSGNSTHPHQIPGLDLWAMTNAATRQKCEIVMKVMDMLGHDSGEISMALAALEG